MFDLPLEFRAKKMIINDEFGGSLHKINKEAGA